MHSFLPSSLPLSSFAPVFSPPLFFFPSPFLLLLHLLPFCPSLHPIHCSKNPGECCSLSSPSGSNCQTNFRKLKINVKHNIKWNIFNLNPGARGDTSTKILGDVSRVWGDVSPTFPRDLRHCDNGLNILYEKTVYDQLVVGVFFKTERNAGETKSSRFMQHFVDMTDVYSLIQHNRPMWTVAEKYWRATDHFESQCSLMLLLTKQQLLWQERYGGSANGLSHRWCA